MPVYRVGEDATVFVIRISDRYEDWAGSDDWPELLFRSSRMATEGAGDDTDLVVPFAMHKNTIGG